jgi:hypothetical protein
LDQKKVYEYKFQMAYLKYVEKNYIELGKDGEVNRANPRFPINYLNLHDRVLKNLPRTNNSVKSWHGSYSQKIKKGMQLIR